MLTRALALRICEIVAADPRCRARIANHQPLPRLAAWGMAGAARNAAMLVAGRRAGTPEFDNFSCVGVTEATTEAITAGAVAGAVRTGRPAPLAEVKHATGVYRVVDGTHHQASWLVMMDGSDYVFDWHKSLVLNDPFAYRTADWRVDGAGLRVAQFTGFDV
jgi:hypothetical protein